MSISRAWLTVVNDSIKSANKYYMEINPNTIQLDCDYSESVRNGKIDEINIDSDDDTEGDLLDALKYAVSNIGENSFTFTAPGSIEFIPLEFDLNSIQTDNECKCKSLLNGHEQECLYPRTEK